LYLAVEGLKQPFSLRGMLRPPYIVPEFKNIDATFREMQRDRVQLAVVIDEYGGTAGIITIEDLLEEIVGNMQDEYDEEELSITSSNDGIFEVSGMATPEEVSIATGVDLPDEDYDTVAGLVINLLGRIPEEDEKPEVSYKNLLFQVLEMDEKRIARLRIIRVNNEPIQGADSND
jgi:putative hemolysin